MVSVEEGSVGVWGSYDGLNNWGRSWMDSMSALGNYCVESEKFNGNQLKLLTFNLF